MDHEVLGKLFTLLYIAFIFIMIVGFVYNFDGFDFDSIKVPFSVST